MTFFKCQIKFIIIIILLAMIALVCQLCTPFATYDFFVSGLIVGTKMKMIFCFQELK